jgi:hypothetical protein
VVTRTGPDGREIIESFIIKLVEATVEASLTQIRVLAEESRELILDRLYNQTPQAPGEARIERPRPLRRPRIKFTDRRPASLRRLADSTVYEKNRLKQDGRKLIATGEYTYGIEVFKGMKKGQPYYTVRPKPGLHPSRNITHRVLAALHEFGTSNMPKRPHWGPVLRKLQKVLKDEGRQVRAVALRQAMRAVR